MIDFISLKNRNDFSFGFSYFKRVKDIPSITRNVLSTKL
ncbi:conserved hypothetical protein [Bacillus cereus AH187]|uniref:Uncharacterized protein n=1 Tax=Bacillus cereus (strain AH187) TaxID=405534 RepID=B7HXS8_BACC7|nr:conserved hypothetical protein [Bacillus cereus AH187]